MAGEGGFFFINAVLKIKFYKCLRELKQKEGFINKIFYFIICFNKKSVDVVHTNHTKLHNRMFEV